MSTPATAMSNKHLTFSTHSNAIGNADSVVLPCKHPILLTVRLYFLAQIQHCRQRIRLARHPTLHVLLLGLPLQGNHENRYDGLTMHAIICQRFLMTLCVGQNVLARVAFPPHTCNAHMWLSLHCFFRGHTCCVQHGLYFQTHKSVDIPG